jgi:FKBP-type peptidyl-prolyl cis-trans isomerase
MRFRLLAPFVLVAAVAGCEPTAAAGPSNPANDSYAASLGVDIASMTKVSDDLYYKDIVVGTGTPAASIGKTIVVNFTGYLTDGRVFDSKTGTETLESVLDEDHLIAGWVYGVSAFPPMKPGGTRKLVIGSAWAFGSGGGGGAVTIPPNATVVFDITLKTVK